MLPPETQVSGAWMLCSAPEGVIVDNIQTILAFKYLELSTDSVKRKVFHVTRFLCLSKRNAQLLAYFTRIRTFKCQNILCLHL
jgi:hypothetical protein